MRSSYADEPQVRIALIRAKVEFFAVTAFVSKSIDFDPRSCVLWMSSSASVTAKRKKLTPDLVASSSSGDEERVEKAIERDETTAEETIKAQKNQDNEYYFDLGKKRRLTIRKWKGSCYVDIREFYEDSDGEQRPGKKGISLSVDQWKTLMQLQDFVEQEISKLNKK